MVRTDLMASTTYLRGTKVATLTLMRLTVEEDWPSQMVLTFTEGEKQHAGGSLLVTTEDLKSLRELLNAAFPDNTSDGKQSLSLVA